MNNRDLINQIVNTKEIYSKRCKVESVDKNKFSCTVSYIENPSIKMNNVRLSPDTDSTFIQFPKVGTTVIVSFLADNVGFVTQTNEVEGYYMATSEKSFLDLILKFIDAIKAIQLLHPQGSTVANGVINIQDFIELENDFKKFFIK